MVDDIYIGSTRTIYRLSTEGIIRALTPMDPDYLDLRLAESNQFELTFEGDTGLRYTLQGATNILLPGWNDILSANFVSTPFLWVIFAVNTNNPSQYFRIVLENESYVTTRTNTPPML